MKTNDGEKITTETITPSIAREWIAKSERFRNRRLNPSHVKHLAGMMRSGQWRMVYDPIRIDDRGRVLDGQHRLHAVVDSDVNIEALVIRGLSEESFLWMDIGRKRTSGDALIFGNVRHAKQVSVALSWLCRIEGGATGNDYQLPQPHEALRFLELHPEIEGSVARCMRASAFVSVGMLSALHFLFAKQSESLADLFIDAVVSGECLRAGDPALELRQKLIRSRGSKVGISPIEQCALAIKAWNMARAGAVCRTLRFRSRGVSPEAFPEIT